MSDTSTPEPAAPATTTPADPVAVPESTVEPAVESSVEPTVERAVEPSAQPAAVAVAAPAEKKKRGVGAWSFVLGLLTVLGDLALIIFGVVLIVGAISSITSGDFSGVATALSAAGLTFLALFLFFGGFLSGGVAALLGFVALVTGRGRVLGVFGLLFGIGAIAVRVGLLSSGFNPDFG